MYRKHPLPGWTGSFIDRVNRADARYTGAGQGREGGN